jgi:DNA-binding MarR family transcriptional regulator
MIQLLNRACIGYHVDRVLYTKVAKTMKNSILEKIELEMAVLVRRVTSITSKNKIGNLDRSAYLLLHQLSVHGPLGVKTLAENLQLDTSTVSRQAASLEKKGYVYKVPDHVDRRAYFLQLTKSGTEDFNEYKKARLDRFEVLTDDWTDEEREQFGHLLKKFNKAILEK